MSGPGEAVAVVGVGPVGMLAMQAARTMGARVFAVDRRPMSLDLAVDLGADGVVNVDEEDPGEALRRLTGGMGPDVVIDAAGGPETTQQSVEWVRNGGRVVLVAIHTSKPEFDFVRVVAKEVEVVGTLAYLQSDVEDVVRHISSGSIVTEPLISDVIGLGRGDRRRVRQDDGRREGLLQDTGFAHKVGQPVSGPLRGADMFDVLIVGGTVVDRYREARIPCGRRRNRREDRGGWGTCPPPRRAAS